MCASFLLLFPRGASDGSDGTTAGRVISPRSIVVHHDLRSKEARSARKQTNRLRQATSHSSLLVARQCNVSRKLNQALIETLSCQEPVKELLQLASDRSIDVLAVQERRRTSLCVHTYLLLPGLQFLLCETPSPGVGGIGFLPSPRVVKALLFLPFPWGWWHWIPSITSCREGSAVPPLPLGLVALDSFHHLVS